MKKNTVFAAILAGTLAVSIQLSSNEIAAGSAYSAPAMNAPAEKVLSTTVINAFKESLKTNQAAGAVVVNSAEGNTLTSFADMDKDYSSNALASAALDKRLAAAANKAFTAGYMGTDTANISDRDLAQHNSSLALAGGATLTNAPGGFLVKDAAGKAAFFVGVSAVGQNGKDLSAKVAAELAQQLAGDKPASGSGFSTGKK